MTQTLLCVTVTGQTMCDVRRARDSACGADLIEVRLDGVSDLDVAGALEGRRRPVVITCRPTWEGGCFDGSEEERRRILESAVALGAEFIDVEAVAACAPDIIRARRGRGVVVSMHRPAASEPDLPALYRTLRSMGAEISKLALMAPTLSATLPLFDLADSAVAQPPSHVLVAMGPSGVPARLLAARLRNRWTFAGDGIAPGQLPLDRVLREFHFRRIRSDSAVYGVAGSPVGHSLSPAMHNAGFAAAGLNATYLPFETSSAEDFVRCARRLGLRGASITSPLKVAMMGYMDDVDPLARRVGAINTIVTRDNRWIGANTDVAGFLAPLSGRIALKGIRAAVLGAGGAARAVAVALSHEGASVTICARRPEAAREIAQLVGGTVGTFPPRAGSWDVLVNATPAGSETDPANPIAGAPLDGEIVFDLVYAPAETQLLADARAAGCMPIGGLEMLIAQAERQFELWTGQRPSAGLFQTAAAGIGIDASAATAHSGSTHDL